MDENIARSEDLWKQEFGCSIDILLFFFLISFFFLWGLFDLSLDDEHQAVLLESDTPERLVWNAAELYQLF